MLNKVTLMNFGSVYSDEGRPFPGIVQITLSIGSEFQNISLLQRSIIVGVKLGEGK